MLHVDPSGSSSAFEAALREIVTETCREESICNVMLAKDIPIIYGTSTASILLSRAMAWFHKYAKG